MPPSVQLSPDELAKHISEFVTNTYAELSKIKNPMNEDFLTTGISRFNERLTEVSAHDFRFMGMLDEARRLEIESDSLARGKKSIAEEQVMIYATQLPRPEVFKGLAADERKAYSKMQCKDYFDDAERWHVLAAELEVLIKHVAEQREFLSRGQQRLLASLWAVKVHGALGELQKQVPGVSHSGQTMMHSVVSDRAPEFAPSNEPQLPQTGSPSNLDDLLEPDGSH